MTEQIIIKVGGMHCVRCQSAVENALKKQKGIINVSVSYVSGRAEIEFEPKLISKKSIEKTIKKAGYDVVENPAVYRKKQNKRLLVLFVLSALLSLPFLFNTIIQIVNPTCSVAIRLAENPLWQFVLATPIQIGIGMRFYIGSVKSLINKSPSMDVTISVGTTAAYIYSTYNLFSGRDTFFFESSAMIITLVLLGKLLESLASSKTSSAVESLLKLTPKKCSIETENGVIEISTDKIKCGDIILLKPGDSAACDGTVIWGTSQIDESMITGESLPVDKKIDSSVIGGTINISGTVKYKATAVGEDTVLSEIVRYVDKARSTKASSQRIADKVSAVFVPVVLGLSVLTVIISLLCSLTVYQSISRAIAVVVVACPCALGLATPVALSVGMGYGASLGILIKDADVLEKICKLKAIVFDKTGTVTQGKLSVDEIICENIDEQTAIRYFASIEKFSSHPIAAAIVQKNSYGELPVVNFKSDAGMGVCGSIENSEVLIGRKEYVTAGRLPAPLNEFYQNKTSNGNSVVFMSVNGSVVSAVSVSDGISPASAGVIKSLKQLGIKCTLATGDNFAVAKRVAVQIGADDFSAELKPLEKCEIIKQMQSKFGLCGFVGDGINDAPALEIADVGFSVSSGTDIAKKSGDVVFVSGKIDLLPKTVKLSFATVKKIKQNLFWAFFYNAVTIPLAAFGVLTPVLSALVMALSSVSVITNSLLLKNTKL